MLILNTIKEVQIKDDSSINIRCRAGRKQKNKYVIVTGGAGYIGSHTCKALAHAGYTPVTYDNLVHGHEWAVKWGPLEIGDIANGKRLLEVFKRYNPIVVMHFAAFAYVGESVELQLKYYRNNVAGTLTLLETMLESAIDKNSLFQYLRHLR